MKCMDFKECLDITQFTQQQNILLNPEYFSKIALTTILNWSRKLMHLNKKINSHKLEASDRTAQNIKFSMKDFFIFCAVYIIGLNSTIIRIIQSSVNIFYFYVSDLNSKFAKR